MKRLLLAFFIICAGVFTPLVSNATTPVAAFSGTPTSGCAPVVVHFTDLSTGTPTSWSWSVTGPATFTSGLQNPNFTFTAAGSYTVALTATNASGSNTHTVASYITITATPTVNFIVSDSLLSCPILNVTFTNGTTGSSSPHYKWDFGDGTTSTLTSPSHSYSLPGSYPITLVDSDGTGCTGSKVKTAYVRVDSVPVPHFAAATTTYCTLPASVTFSNTSTGATTYKWYFGDGTTSTAATPTHSYTASGTYTDTLIAFNAVGCSDTLIRTSYISVGNLIAAFTFGANDCINNSIAFTNGSSPTGYTSAWVFGDGATSGAANPTHTYTSAGTYNVRLVIHSGSCTDTVIHSITVITGPVASFSASSTYNCTAPFTPTFTNSSTGATGYTWHFGDGGSSTATTSTVTHTYTATGTYTVTLIATSASGCSDTDIVAGYITIGAPTATITLAPTIGCAPASVAYSASSTPAGTTDSVSFGDGTPHSTSASGTHIFTTGGTFTVKYYYHVGTGCAYSTTATITISSIMPNSAPTASAYTICPTISDLFDSHCTNCTAYTWLFGDGTSAAGGPTNSHSYGGPGTDTVKLISTDGGCKDTTTLVVRVDSPSASFTYALTGCSNHKAFTFTNLSLGGATYSWTFGDGGTSTLKNPTHTYTAYGVDTVKLTVTSDSGCTNKIAVPINIYPAEDTFSVSDTTICAGSTVTFTAASFPTGNTGQHYTWVFGDGNTASVGFVSVTNTYTVSGIDSVRLITKDTYGCIDTLVKHSYIHVAMPVPSFTVSSSSGCVPLSVTFTDASTDIAGTAIVGRTWGFGDGANNLGNATSVSHTYVTSGVYSVILVDTDAYGCIASYTYNSVSPSKPHAYFTTPDTLKCPGFPIVFTDTTTGSSYHWSFGDGTTSTVKSPTHIYTASGFYSDTLIVTNSSGCKDTMVRHNYIDIVNMTAGFTLSDTAANCPPLVETITNTSTGSNTYSWTFGNGGTSTLTSPSTVYTFPGLYSVTMIATNIYGCVDTVVHTVDVHGPIATISYSPLTGCAPLTVSFSSVYSSVDSFTWSSGSGGGGVTSASSTFSYTYTSAGSYVPVLLVSKGTCRVSYTGVDTIKVDHLDAAFTFSPTTICSSGTVNFRDSVLSSSSAVSTRSWTFGDGGTSTAHNPSHAYASSGSYTVRLIMTDATGCADTVIHTVIISPPPTISGGPAQTICSGGSTTLTASGGSTYTWAAATGLSATTGTTVTASPTSTRTYTVTGTDTNGCVNTATVVVTVSAALAVAASPISICNGSTGTLTASGASTYTWSPSGSLSASTGTSVTANPTATTTYTLIGTSGTCHDTSTVAVTVNALPPIDAGTPTGICIGSSTTLTASGGSTYTWSPATTLSASTGTSVTATPTSTTVYTVTGTLTSTGCHNTDTVRITVNPLPTISAGADVTICAASSATLTATGGSTYIWSPSTGLSATTGASVTAHPSATTTYIVTGTNASGCHNTDTVIVTVSAALTVAASPISICNGTSGTLTASGASTYTWSPSTGLSASTGVSVTANPTATTTYTLIGTAGTCHDTSTVAVTVNALPPIDAGTPTGICIGSSTTLTASGGSTYTWSPATTLSASTGTSVTATPTSTTVYTVTGTLTSTGCHNTDTVRITVNPLPTISAGADVTICAASSATLTATGGSTYTWSPSTGLSATTGASVTAHPSATTTYIVTGTNASGCHNTDTVIVTVSAALTVAASPISICNGTSGTLTASGASTYTWSPSTGLSASTGASVTANPTATTTYTLIGTAGTCHDTSTVAVTVNALPPIDAGTPTGICIGSSTTLTASGGSTYTWSPATTLSASTGISVTATPATTTVYTVTGTLTSTGCHNTDTVRITVNPLPTISAGADVTICAASSATLTATGGSTYTWSPSTGLSATTGASVTAHPSATTTYIVTGINASGCHNTDTVIVTVSAALTVAASPISICNGTSGTLTASGASTYTWSPSTGLSASTGSSVTANPTATTTYTLIGTAGTCHDTSTVAVTVNALPAIDGGANTSVCSGSSATLTASGGTTYTWSPAATLSASTGTTVTATPTATTLYTVTGTNATSCTNTDTVRVTVNLPPTIDGGANQTICAAGSATLTASGGASYTWSPSTGLSATTGTSVTAHPTASTLYSVTGTDIHGCMGTDTVRVTVSAALAVTASPISVCNGTSGTLTASGASTYTWSPSTGLSASTGVSVTADPTVTTTYTLIGTAGTCHDTSTVIVTVNALPVISGGSAVSICSGTSTTLTATGGASYTWAPAATLSASTGTSVTATPATTTTYTVTGTDINGCHNTGTVAVTVNTPPTIDGGANQTICAGSAATLTASGGVTYTWSPSSSLSASTGTTVSATPSATTLYTVTGTDIHSCTNTDTVRVTVNAALIVSASPISLCNGTSGSLTASGASTYTWSPSTGLSASTGVSVTANPTATTTYTLIGTSGTCHDTSTVIVTVNALPTITGGAAVSICSGTSTTLTGTGGVSYTWAPAATLSASTGTSVTATPTATTTYTVTGTDINGCHNTGTVAVTVNTPPVINAGPDQVICVGSSTTLSATGGSTYTWSPATGLSASTGASVTATPAATTSYTVTGTDIHGCIGTDTVTVTVNAALVVSASPITTCSGTAGTLTATGATTYTWSPATGLSATTGTTVSADPAATTTYTLIGSSGTCHDTTSVVVTINPLPTIIGTGGTTVCSGTADTLTASGGVTYTWSPSAGLSASTGSSVTATPAATTTFTIIGTDAHGCVNTTTQTVTVNPLPTVSGGPDVNVCIGFTATLSASGASTYTWSPAAGLSCTSCAGPVVTTDTSIVYTVTGTDAHGCINTADVNITVNPAPTVSVDTSVIICAGTSYTFSAVGASSYAWSPATGLSCTACFNPTATPAASTNYTLVATSSAGCKDTIHIAVTVGAGFTSSAGPDTTMCIGNSVTLTATGASLYTWSPSATLSSSTGASVTATPAATTTYTVTADNGLGCTITDTVRVTVNPLPTISAGAAVSICAGSSTPLTATGGSIYTWSPSATLSASTGTTITATPTVTTTYTVTGTNASGCTDTSSVTVTVNPIPVVTADSAISICSATSDTIHASGATTYSWSPATGLSCTTCAAPVANPAATTTYTVTGTSLGCSATATTTVTVMPLPAISGGPAQSLCTGDSVTMTATGGVSYTWSPATGLSCTTCAITTASPATTTTYTVTGTGANGCINTSTSVVTVNPLPHITSASQSVCLGSSATLVATGGVSYTWSPATGLSATTGATVTATPADTTTYLITGTDINGCRDTSSVTVFTKLIPVVTASNDTTICDSSSAHLHVAGATSYLWTPAANLSCTTCVSPVASPTATTVYSVVGITNGCSDTTMVTVSVNPLPIITAGPNDSVCKGGSVSLTATGGVTYIWSPATGLSATTGATVIATPPAPVNYIIKGTGTNGCVGKGYITVGIYPQPIVSVGSTSVTLCLGQTDVLNATGATSYAWSPATGLSATTGSSVIASPAVDTKYTITGTSIHGCIDSTHVTFTVIDPVPTTVGLDDTICKGQSAGLSATGGQSYLWIPATGLNNNQIADPSASPDTTTTYQVLITENACFTDTLQETVLVNPLPAVIVPQNVSVIAGSSIQLDAGAGVPGTTYLWTPSEGLNCTTCENPLATPTATTTYSVAVTTPAGCATDGVVTVLVGCDKSQIFIPNTFTPNGDGVNDRFFVSGKGISIIKRIAVYDRWGELVYSAENIPANEPAYGWDGTFKGKIIPPDVFVYIVDAMCETGQPLSYKGDVSVVR